MLLGRNVVSHVTLVWVELTDTVPKISPTHLTLIRQEIMVKFLYYCCGGGYQYYTNPLWPRPLLQERCITRTVIARRRTQGRGWVWWRVRVQIVRLRRISVLFPPSSCSESDRKFPRASPTGASFTTASSTTSCTAARSGSTPTSRCSLTRCCFHSRAKWEGYTRFKSRLTRAPVLRLFWLVGRKSPRRSTCPTSSSSLTSVTGR